MKILFFSHYFPPEVNAPATRTYEHCRRWAAAGHEVTVVTGVPNCPTGVAYAGYRNRFRRQVEMVDGIRVVRVWTYLAANSGRARRIASYVSYQLSSMLASVRLPRPDVVIATSPQFFAGWAGVWVARLKRRPLVLEIRDIWPESIAAVGAMRKGLAIRCLQWLEPRMYRAATHIVAVGTGYRDKVLEKAPQMSEHISVITNGVDADKFIPQAADADFLQQYALTGKFVCSYVGTVGMAHGLSVVVRAACRLRDQGRNDIVFLIVGDGAEREDLERRAAEAGVMDWLRFTGRLSREEMPRVLASSDCCLVHLRGNELFGTVIPSKIFEIMAMQRPIVMGVKGPALNIVLAAKAGEAMEPEDDQQLAEILARLADQPTADATIGAHARDYVLRHYGRDGLAEEYLQLLLAIAKQPLPRTAPSADSEEDKNPPALSPDVARLQTRADALGTVNPPTVVGPHHNARS